MTQFYLLRHGEIEWSETDCFIGQIDPPLSPQGRLQAGVWRNVLQRVAFAAAWSSDLARAAETAAIIFSRRTPRFKTCKDLREIRLGEWDGVSRSRVRKDRLDLWRARGEDLAGFRPPGGESFWDLQERVLRAVSQIAASTNGPVCLVTHAGVIRVLICHCLEMPLMNLFRIRLDYGSLSIVAYAPERIEVCALNLKPSNFVGAADGKIGGLHDPAQV